MRAVAEVEEPLAISAPLAWARAPALCPPRTDSREECLWYHRVWQYLRLLGFITSVTTNAQFLLDFFRQRARAGDCRRVLITGAADYSLLAHVAHAYRSEGAPLDVTLVDRCATPLLLNGWYAERYGIRLHTREGDALEYAADEPCDVVCTHNFLTRFRAAERPRLFAAWRGSLRPGGVVVTTQRIRPNETSERDSYSEDEALALARRVESAARMHDGLGVDAAELGASVYEYAIRKGGWVVRSVTEVTRALEAAGFRIERADEGGGIEERRHDKASTPAGLDTYRTRLVATRSG